MPLCGARIPSGLVCLHSRTGDPGCIDLAQIKWRLHHSPDCLHRRRSQAVPRLIITQVLRPIRARADSCGPRARIGLASCLVKMGVAVTRKSGCRLTLVSVQDQIDTDSPMGRAMFTIIGVMAELESSLISERVTAGMRAAEARGNISGALPSQSGSSARSRPSPSQRISASVRSKPRSQARPVAGSSVRSSSGPVPAPSPGL